MKCRDCDFCGGIYSYNGVVYGNYNYCLSAHYPSHRHGNIAIGKDQNYGNVAVTKRHYPRCPQFKPKFSEVV